MAAPDAMVVMGEVLVPFGVRGWIKIRPFTQTTDGLLQYSQWWLRAPKRNDWTPMSPTDGRAHSDTLVARLEGIETREAAQALRGSEIAVPRSALPNVEDDEIYWADLIGLEVVNRDGAVLGRVAEVKDFGAQPLLRVVLAEAEREQLIPFVPAHVHEVDFAAGRIGVDWKTDFA
jgi:16S rRNA processing protein RimM